MGNLAFWLKSRLSLQKSTRNVPALEYSIKATNVIAVF